LKAQLLLLFIGISLSSFAQKPVVIDGFVREDGGGDLEYARVLVEENGIRVVTAETNQKGKFKFDLSYEHLYTIRFEKKGYVAKIIEIDTREVPEDHKRWGHEFGGWEVSLFRDIEQIDLSALDKPVARMFYEEDEGNFGWDYAYIRSVKPAVDALEKEVKKLRKDQEKFLAEQIKNFELILKDAQNLQKAGEFEQSLKKYEEAYAVKGEDGVRMSIEEVKDIIATNEAYRQLLGEAKDAEGSDDLETALSKMQGALALKPSESYPSIEVDRLLKEINRRRDEVRLQAAADIADMRAEEDSIRQEKEKTAREEAAKLKSELELAERQAREANEQALQAERDSMKAFEMAGIASGKEKLDLMDKKSEEFINELAKVYPEGVTEEIIQMSNRVITKRIVVSEGKGYLYEFVKYNWGGEFFFKNGESASKFVWDKETVIKLSDK